MLFKQIYDEKLAQASYFIGCQKTGEAVVVDPRRDIDIYLDEAAKNDMTIVAVTETHIHADYLSGSLELATKTGAKLYLSDEGGEDWQYRFEHTGLRDGDKITIGNITLEVLHTPGHTPEHISFLVTDGATTDKPGFLLSGDFVFVGDTGRPDLLDESAGTKDTRKPMARQLFKSLQEKFLTLPDYVQVWPGHGAGSACGKALGAVPSTTVGYESLFAWWAGYLEKNDSEGFVDELISGQPDAPAYFGRMKRWNRAGSDILGERDRLEHYTPSALPKDTLFIDTRPHAEFIEGFIPGSLNCPAGKRFIEWAAWTIDPEHDERTLVLLASDADQARQLRDELSRVGIDNVEGFVTELGTNAVARIDEVEPEGLDKLDAPYILDIRALSEFNEGHIPGAQQLHGGRVIWNLDKIPKDKSVVMHCRSGTRVGPVASALHAAGFDNVLELKGSYEGWLKANKVAT